MLITIAEIIGVLGFLLALFNTFEKFYTRWHKKLRYYIIKSKTSSYLESFSNNNTESKTYCRIIIEIMLINKGGAPITVHGLSLSDNNQNKRFSCVEKEYLRSELTSRIYGTSHFAVKTGMSTQDKILTDQYSTAFPVLIPPYEARYIKTYFIFEKEFHPEKLTILTYKNLDVPNEYYINDLKHLLSSSFLDNH